METRLRVLLVLAGLPTPEVQVTVSADGRTFRFDLAYPQERIAIEYDGAHHFDSEAQKKADVRRNDPLRREGWTIVSVVSRGILRDPAGTIDQIAWLLTDRGRSVRRSAEWTVHFPQAARDRRGLPGGLSPAPAESCDSAMRDFSPHQTR